MEGAEQSAEIIAQTVRRVVEEIGVQSVVAALALAILAFFTAVYWFGFWRGKARIRDQVERADIARRAAEAAQNAAEERRKVAELKTTVAQEALERYVIGVRDALRGDVLGRPLPPDVETPLARFGRSRIPIVTFGNLKGGVGKTTLAANFGAYLADTRPTGPGLRKRVLFIDLDFQGSLSATMLSAAGGELENRVEQIFQTDQPPELLLKLARPLQHRHMRDCAFFDIDYEATKHEDKILYEWAVEAAPSYDVRLLLGAFLLSPAVQERFDAVVIDLPPRNTTYAFNALAAATDLVIPAKADDLSVAAVERYARQLRGYREALFPSLSIAGVVGTFINQSDPSDPERHTVRQIVDEAARVWPPEAGEIRLLGYLPAKQEIAYAAGKDFAYFGQSSQPTHAAAQLRAICDSIYSSLVLRHEEAG